MKERTKENQQLSPEEQKKAVKGSIDQELQLGQKWYMIDKKWFETWQEYVDYDDLRIADAKERQRPGPIDNGALFDESEEKKGSLRDSLNEGVDIKVVPEAVWNTLVVCYGITSDQDTLPCPVIEQGQFTKSLAYELYPLELFLSLYKEPTEGKLEKISKGTTVGELQSKMRDMYEISESSQTKLVGNYMSAKFEDLDDDQTVSEAQLIPRQFVVLLVKEGANWPDPNKYKTAMASSNATTFKSKTTSNSAVNGANGTNSSDNKYKPTQTSNGYSGGSSSSWSNNKTYSTRGAGSSSYSSSYDYSDSVSASNETTKGLCGLSNLGNTCFMNSSIQCMSNVPKLTDFFNSDKWKKDLNRDNPLGMKGEIAASYAKLIHTMWKGKYSSTSPREFKSSVGAFAPRFSGYQQHDSQELMVFLLDGLHEDLNRIRKKPYVEMESPEGRPDRDIARESWDNYRLRNDSIIVDLFHGQLKSTLHCPKPECGNVSVIFDPFCYLPLPIPAKTSKQLNVVYVPSDLTQRPTKCRVKVPVDGRFSDLCDAVSKVLNVKPKNLVATEVHRNRYHRIYDNTYSLSKIQDSDQIFAYELDVPANHVIVGVYIREIDTSSKYGSSSPTALGLPILMALPEEVTFDQLYRLLRERCSRFINKDAEAAHMNGAANQSTQNGGDEEPMDVCGSPKSTDAPTTSTGDNNSHLFRVHLVSQYGSREHDDVSTEGTTTLKNNSYISVEFDKSIVGSVVDSEEAMNLETHDSVHITTKVAKPQVTLADCLRLFTKCEELSKEDTWYCPKCKDHVQATKQFGLWKLPQYLVVQLKRYKSSAHQYTYYREKNDAFVDYPVKSLELSPWVLDEEETDCQYDLLSASNHYGGLGGGHYTAYAKNDITKKWYYFDDSSVSTASVESVVNKAGYILVYERRQKVEERREESMVE